ncbi:MAG: TonB family protein, partial [Bacteroidota bacterium]|nr:TonB family protein [Bacteroidota bacterium]
SIIVSNSTMMTTTDANGRFALSRIPDGSSLIFTYKGYKTYILPPLISSNMTLRIKLVKDPDYKEEPAIRRPQQPEPLVVIDGVITDKRMQDAYKELGYNFGLSKVLIPKEAVDKYGDKGANGVVEITTRKKALEMGLNPPMRRLAPADYPTFEGKDRMKFNEWVTEQVKYPAEAKEKKAEGYVTVNFTINLDGTLTDIRSLTSVDPSLANEVINVVKSSPKWDPPRNPEIKEPFTSGVTIGFKLPDKIIDQMPFVVVEEMPLYPGGEGELLRFIQNNLKYPEEAKAQKIEGKVIIRFVVNTEGKTEGISVIKGVHPLLDAEAIRIVSILPAFKPGMQGGKPVPVWYMVPVNFILPDTEKP